MKKIYAEHHHDAGSGTLEGYVVNIKEENWKIFLEKEMPDIASYVIENIEKSGIEKIAVLKSINVDPAARGYGLGGALMNSFFEEDFELAILAADSIEEQALGFSLVKWYESYDFVAVPHASSGVRLMGYGDKLDWLNLIPRFKSKP